MKRLYESDPFSDAVPAALNFLGQLFSQGIRQTVADVGHFQPHLDFRFLPFRGKDEESHRREYRRHDNPGDVRGGRRRRQGHDGAEPEGAGAGRGSSGDGITRVIGDRLRLTPRIVGIDDALGLAGRGIDQSRAVVVELS